MIYIGIDDTDTIGTPGTNQLARRLAMALPSGFEFVVALRHQLFFDPRVPYTSKNGCATLLVRAAAGHRPEELAPMLRAAMSAWYVPGSDPGLCVTEHVPEAVVEFGRRTQHEVIQQKEARELARRCGVFLRGFGGTEDGVIGALAGVGLLAAGEDGRVVDRPGWGWPDTFAGEYPVGVVQSRGVDEVREAKTDQLIEAGVVDVGKHLRPSYRGGRVVLYVQRAGEETSPHWSALKLP
ncbi:MAG: hypothetical protein Q8K55_14880 [Gemmatimonadaceae bacterium]|nr:hypothetical protein [Gemmatimonadaceae bacterium]